MLPLQKPGGPWRIAREPKKGAPDAGTDWRNADNQTLYPFNSAQNYAAFSAWVFPTVARLSALALSDNRLISKFGTKQHRLRFFRNEVPPFNRPRLKWARECSLDAEILMVSSSDCAFICGRAAPSRDRFSMFQSVSSD
ncbi:hypothetical protein MesoLj113a_18420 [Mesorhizobium sp. 113-1-2]|nr:hypothetical protein MesoLj113a_18420 [Mesorhizobium sp. 113-1-2]